MREVSLDGWGYGIMGFMVVRVWLGWAWEGLEELGCAYLASEDLAGRRG